MSVACPVQQQQQQQQRRAPPATASAAAAGEHHHRNHHQQAHLRICSSSALTFASSTSFVQPNDYSFATQTGLDILFFASSPRDARPISSFSYSLVCLAQRLVSSRSLLCFACLVAVLHIIVSGFVRLILCFDLEKQSSSPLPRVTTTVVRPTDRSA